MKQMRFVITLCLLLAFCGAQAQDVHFSQYYFSPLSLNPANTGNMKGDYRLFANYRTQWKELGQAYRTYSGGGDLNFYPSNQQLSAGLIFINDLSGTNMSVNKILPSFAAHRKLAGFEWHAGVQPGVVIRSIDFFKNSFPDQLNWETGHFDHRLPNSETDVNQRLTYLDLNAGVAVSRKFGALEAAIGFAAFHVNNPRESFFGGRKHLPGRQVYHALISYRFGALVAGIHSMYVHTTRVSDWVGGINLEYVLSRDAFFTNSFFAGVMHRSGIKRNPDAVIATAGLNFSNYTMGFSFDLTRSQLKTAVDSRGAFELAIIYRSRSTRLNKKALPCERY